MSSRLKIIFWVALENFVFPGEWCYIHQDTGTDSRLLVIFSIALLIDEFVDPEYFVHDSILLLVNYYVSLIGVVFATGKYDSYDRVFD